MRTRFILIDTSHAGNVGAAARALRVMGFDELVLVNPRQRGVLRTDEAIQRASGANEVLARARIAATLDEALDGISHLCATAMTPRDFGPPTRTPREHLTALAAQLRPPHASSGDASAGDAPAGDAAAEGTDGGVGFLFGPERFGLKNEDVYRCHVCLSIPTDPAFGSLNLAAAVQVIAYEWRLALGGFDVVPATREPVRADAQAVAGLLSHWEQALVEIGFLDPQAPKKLLPRLNQLVNRASLAEEEVHILRGVAKAMIDLAHKAKR